METSVPVGQPWGDEATPYEAIGGDAAVRELSNRFYDIVEETAPTLRAMLPKDDSISRTKLYEFLSGWMGGPPLYMEKRGHPRLRMRHMPFTVGPLERDRWLLHRAAAVERVCAERSVPEDIAEEMMAYFVPAAEHLRNDSGLPISSPGHSR